MSTPPPYPTAWSDAQGIPLHLIKRVCMTDSARGDSVIILFRGGRLPQWHQLDEVQRRDYERQHVDLMLSVSERHGLIGIHGYRLLAPQNSWERFWTIEFPDLAGAEAWMSAEVEPPYGSYGFYDYSLARRWQPESLAWLPRKPELPVAPRRRSAPNPTPDRRSLLNHRTRLRRLASRLRPS